MRKQSAQPSYLLSARVDEATERCRRRLQRRTKMSVAELLREALQKFEMSMSDEPEAA